MRRGDVVTVAATGDYGKPRPAVIVQTDALPAEHASVVVCQMTSEGDDAQDFRVAVEPSTRNGLRTTSRDWMSPWRSSWAWQIKRDSSRPAGVGLSIKRRSSGYR